MEFKARISATPGSEIGSSVGPMEMRSRVRHRLYVDAVFSWLGAQDRRLEGVGVTRDISFCGAYIFSLTSPPAGARIDLAMSLFTLDSRGKRTLRLKTDATVVRVDHGRAVGEEGFAVILDDLSLSEAIHI
jgi:hypothetical protein